MHPGKTQISLGIYPVRSESSLCAQWVTKDQSFIHAVSKDSDKTKLMSRLIQCSHRLKKYLNIQVCLEKSLKIKFALKST